MPGLGFTKTGDRIGRGKGYYDNYLKKCAEKGVNPYTVALCYREQLCEEIPLTSDDKTVDHVLFADEVS